MGELGLRGSQTAGAPACHKYAARVRFVLCDGIANHVADSLAVAAAAVGQACFARHVPARPAVGTRRPEREVALGVGAAVPGDERVLEVGLRAGLARVDHDYLDVCGWGVSGCVA